MDVFMIRILLVLATALFGSSCTKKKIAFSSVQTVGKEEPTASPTPTPPPPHFDFYSFVNTLWLYQVELPHEAQKVDFLDEINYTTAERLLTLLKEKVGSGTTPSREQQIISQIYLDYMDQKKLEELGFTPLLPLFKQIDLIADSKGLMKVWGTLQPYHLELPLTIKAVRGHQHSKPIVRVQFAPSLMERQNKIELHAELGSSWHKLLTQMLTALNDPAATQNANALAKIDESLYTALKQRAEGGGREGDGYHQPLPIDKLKKDYPGVAWNDFLAGAELDSASDFIVLDSGHLATLDRLISAHPLSVWKIYLKTRLMLHFAPLMTQQISAVAAEFYDKAGGSQAGAASRELAALGFIDVNLNELLTAAYSQRFATDKELLHVKKLVTTVVETYRSRIKSADWLSAKARTRIDKQLGTISFRIGHPESLADYSKVTLNPGNLLENVLRLQEETYHASMRSITGPTFRPNVPWPSSPLAAFSAYDAATNQLTLTDGILVPPLYYAADPAPSNYGALGFHVSRMISTALLFNEEYLEKEDQQQLAIRASQLKKILAAELYVQKRLISDEMVLNQSIPDLIALSVAYDAFKSAVKSDPEVTTAGRENDAQVFFMSFATLMRQKLSSQIEFAAKNSENMPLSNRDRVNSILKHSHAFHQAFGLKDNSAYLFSENVWDRIIW
jgi:predicted metalloendopeptidase